MIKDKTALDCYENEWAQPEDDQRRSDKYYYNKYLKGPLEAPTLDLWSAEICICISREGGKPPIRNTVGSDKTDDKAERIDDKLLTVLARVFRASPPADMYTVSLLSDANG